MPFIPKAQRKKVDDTGEWEQVGDLCYMFYKSMVSQWRDQPRWTKAHDIYKRWFDATDEETAMFLAYLVFFVKEVMPYEYEKVKENGDV